MRLLEYILESGLLRGHTRKPKFEDFADYYGDIQPGQFLTVRNKKWFRDRYNRHQEVELKDCRTVFVHGMEDYCGKTVVVNRVPNISTREDIQFGPAIIICEDRGSWVWRPWMFEDFTEPDKKDFVR